MKPEDLWSVLSVEEGTWHRLDVLYDDRQSPGHHTDDLGWALAPEGQRWGTAYVPVGARERFERLVAPLVDSVSDVQVSLVPRRGETDDVLGLAGVMWARLETGAQAVKLKSFRPGPSMVLQEGESVRRVALWFVDPHPNIAQLERGNRRLAHALGCKKKFAGAEQLVHVPGTVIRWGRGRKPLMVHVEHYSGEFFTPAQVAGRLRDAPDPWTPESVAA